MEDFASPSLESSDGLTSGTEKTPEKSEKQRESYKKAQAQIQKAQKDEKKAKGDNDQLFAILERFIQNPYYEELVPLMTTLLQKSVPSRYILTLIALFYPEATIHLLATIGKHDDIELLLKIHRHEEGSSFDEATLHPSIRTWMSTWVHAWQVYITDAGISRIIEHKLYVALQEDVFLTEALATGLQFFFASRNLTTSSRVMMRYAEHITQEYKSALEKSLSHGDQSLLENPAISDQLLFGITQEDDRSV